MAHPEHLKILLRSTEEWNRWRKTHEDVQPDLEQADLHGADLYRADLGGANLRAANLTRAHLFEAYLGRADLRGADLQGANLARASLAGANLAGAHLRGADLKEANLDGADLTGASLHGADLTATKFDHVRGLDEKERLGGPEGKRGRAALRIVVEDGLGFPHTFVPASYLCLLFCTVPETWLGHDRRLLPDKHERILERHYGTKWRLGNEDGSRYVIRRFDVEPLASADALEQARQSIDKASTGVRYWFYLIDEEDQLKAVDKEAFFEEAGREAVVRETKPRPQ
jgi:hypothetical protein